MLVTLVAVLVPWLPTSASREMDRIAFVFWFATAISIGIVTFRAAPEDEADGPSIHGHTGLEIVWTVVSGGARHLASVGFARATLGPLKTHRAASWHHLLKGECWQRARILLPAG